MSTKPAREEILKVLEPFARMVAIADERHCAIGVTYRAAAEMHARLSQPAEPDPDPVIESRLKLRRALAASQKALEDFAASTVEPLMAMGQAEASREIEKRLSQPAGEPSRIRCDCVDSNGNVWPDCTCDHGWRVVHQPAAKRAESADLKRLDFLRELQPGWNSYKAPSIDERAIQVAEAILSTPGQAVPTSQGGVQIEWHCGGVDVEFEIAADGTIVEESAEPSDTGWWLVERYLRYHDGVARCDSAETVQRCSCAICCDARAALTAKESQ